MRIMALVQSGGIASHPFDYAVILMHSVLSLGTQRASVPDLGLHGRIHAVLQLFQHGRGRALVSWILQKI